MHYLAPSAMVQLFIIYQGHSTIELQQGRSYADDDDHWRGARQPTPAHMVGEKTVSFRLATGRDNQETLT